MSMPIKEGRVSFSIQEQKFTFSVEQIVAAGLDIQKKPSNPNIRKAFEIFYANPGLDRYYAFAIFLALESGHLASDATQEPPKVITR